MRSILRNIFVGGMVLVGMGLATTAIAQVSIDYRHQGRTFGLVIGDYPPPRYQPPRYHGDYPPPRRHYDCPPPRYYGDYPPPRYGYHGMSHTYRNFSTGEYRRVSPNGHTTYRPFYGHPTVEQPFPGHPYIPR